MSIGIDELLNAAKEAKSKAYAPYSDFHVGAALVSEAGNLYSGCNVENTSYGLTNCAERTAIFKMVSEGENRIKKILVIGDTEEFLPPCGACRQVIAEFSKPDTVVYMSNKHGEIKEATVADLIPFTFFLKDVTS